MTMSTTGESTGGCGAPAASAGARFPKVTLETVKRMSSRYWSLCVD
jgi:hypothetical protein